LADGETASPVEMCGLIHPFHGLRIVKIFEFQYEPSCGTTYMQFCFTIIISAEV
jgi:hypothetical protein